MYRLTDSHDFVIEDYQNATPFSSFLPGIAGKAGIPIWAFYVNRGQVMAGFGVQNKDYAINEFYPADKSYQLVPTQGFRTFIKCTSEAESFIIEPFAAKKDNPSVKESLTINANAIQLNYVDEKHGISLKVEYYALPHSPLAGLIREVTLKNIGEKSLDIELVDGLTSIFPSGVSNAAYKELGNTMKSWFDVDTIKGEFNYYYLRGSTEDEASVSEVHRGNFYASMLTINGEEQIVNPIYDRTLIFGNDLTLQCPRGFESTPVRNLLDKQQVSTNKVSCGFTPVETSLQPGSQLTINTVIGYGENRESVQLFINDKFNGNQLADYKETALAITDKLTDAVETKTAEPLFDAYVKQNYLDNGLRGGFPTIFDSDEVSKIFYLYSRKHGDLERDYNFFSISPTYYSQGNGNYRDMNQNRRLDVMFQPKVKDYNIQHFVNLIQLDGYNPLAIKEVQFTLDISKIDFDKYGIRELETDKLRQFFSEKFTPGKLMMFMQEQAINLSVSFDAFLADVLTKSVESLAATHGEGFWIDHWTYNLDLLDSYLTIYPDKVDSLFFNKAYRFFDSPASVNGRDAKYVNKKGIIRQYEAVTLDEDKLQSQQKSGEQWLKTEYGKGEVFETNLYSKLFLLAVIKTATIAPYGLGIEMEAGKPGWNDALNGLPGMIGASTSELYELKRLIKQLDIAVSDRDDKVLLPEESAELITNLALLIKSNDWNEAQKALDFWKNVSDLRENYRESLQNGISGEILEISIDEVKELLTVYQERVDHALASVEDFNKQELVPTYFYFDAEVNADQPSDILTCTPHAVTPFLEGIVKKLKLSESIEEAEHIYDAVRKSTIYDEKLGMYKTSASIEDEPNELGRANSFTPGWLENESIFMHMEYKYLLELLKGGLTEQFYRDMKTALVPFLDPAIYGRSTLENSSFIASSANPDPSIHGRGFVARLSGSTIEFLNMWFVMFIGKRPFSYDNETDSLKFQLQPILPKWLFREDDSVSFTLFNQIEVTYNNPKRRDTFGKGMVQPVGYSIYFIDGRNVNISGTLVEGELAETIRTGDIERIFVELN